MGTDSHTTMIDGSGVLGWGVGGIEGEAVMLGQPISMVIPEVRFFYIIGKIIKFFDKGGMKGRFLVTNFCKNYN